MKILRVGDGIFITYIWFTKEFLHTSSLGRKFTDQLREAVGSKD